MLEFITKFRKTFLYKICGWFGFAVIILVLLLILKGRNSGFAALGYLAMILIIGRLYIVVAGVCTVVAIIQAIQNKLTQKVSIIADIGYIIPLIFIFHCLYSFNSQATKHYLNVDKVHHILYGMQYAYPDGCRQSQQKFAECMGEAIKKTSPTDKVEKIENNVISTTNYTYTVIVDGTCNKDGDEDLKNENCRIELRNKNGKDKYLKIILKYQDDNVFDRKYFDILYYQICDKKKCSSPKKRRS